MSYPEVLLWQRLRGAAAGAKFRRQHPIGPYVADFCCLAARLVIEVDGEVHAEPGQLDYDRHRDQFMIDNGWQIARVKAADLLKNTDRVAEKIAALVARPLHHASHGPPPRAGEDQE